MTIRRLLPAALLATVALLGAGCGGDSDQPSATDARSAYESIRTQVSDLGSSIGEAIGDASNQTDAQLSAAFAQLRQRGREAVERLRGLEVPDELHDERDALREAVDEGSEDLADIARAARDHDAAAARDAVRRLVDDSQAIRAARGAFERALDEAAE